MVFDENNSFKDFRSFKVIQKFILLETGKKEDIFSISVIDNVFSNIENHVKELIKRSGEKCLTQI